MPPAKQKGPRFTPPSPTRNQLAESQIRWDAIQRILINLMKYGFYAFLVFQAGEVLRAYAGTVTKVEAVALLKAAVTLSADRWAAYSLASVMGAGWFLERRRAVTMTADHAAKFKRLEQLIDPGRSSSGLPLSGEPRT